LVVLAHAALVSVCQFHTRKALARREAVRIATIATFCLAALRLTAPACSSRFFPHRNTE
jgi:hypothetical protein